MNSRRRNGKLASCEPCRKDKVRCDHRVPVCSRCQRRRSAARCFYHPAPLTRVSAEKEDPRKASQSSTSRSSVRSRTFTPAAAASDAHDLTPEQEELYISTADRPTGYLGPTSFVAAFEEDQGLVSSPNDRYELCKMNRNTFPSCLSSHQIGEMKRVLGYLQELSFMDSLIQEYYAISEAAVIPKPLVLNSLAQVKADHSLRKGFSETEITWILENTIQQFDIQPTIEGRDFHELFTGPNLRLETVALIYSLAGIANMFCLTQDKSSPRNLLEYRSLFAKRMLLASDTILQICKILTPVNDLTIWVLYENVILSTVVYGDYSSTKWHRLGELSTHMFELGLHRDSHQSPDLPPFLVESRRRLFAAAYQLDKSIATFLGRPPRITQRHSDCRLPLDIGDEALSSNAQIALASQSLDSNGWNLHGRFQRSAWIRLRFLISTFREEILELSLQSSKEETADQLRDVSRRCHQTWDALPAHLRYTSNWDESLSFATRLFLVVSYLMYLHNDFLVQRLLVQRDPEAQAPLLDVSATLLSTVLVFGTHHQHMIDIQRDFTWVILLYGFPSAGVLIKALQKEARTGHPMPYKGSRSLLIRNLSVLISHLESISRPNIANHELFARASKVLSIILDEVLEPRDPGASSKVDFDAFPATIDGLGELEDMNLVDTMEWGGVFDQWIL